jgi:hypothetical protein
LFQGDHGDFDRRSRQGILGNHELDTGNPNRVNIHALCTLAIAALILHAPGLRCQIKYNEHIAKTIGALIGSVCEGAFVLLLLSKMLSLSAKLFQEAKSHIADIRHFTFASLKCLMSAVGVFSFAVSIIAFSATDYTFQTMSGGGTPNMWIVANGIKNAADVGRQLATDSDNNGSSNVYEVCFFFALAVVVYAIFHWHAKPVKDSGDTRDQNRYLLAAGATAVLAYSLGAWYVKKYGCYPYSVMQTIALTQYLFYLVGVPSCTST